MSRHYAGRPADDPVVTLATDSCIVGLVDKDWRPVAPGTPSASVLVTNLYNRVQPLIRYELTDSFTQQPGGAENGRLRVIVDGRSDDILHYRPTPTCIRWCCARFC